MLVVPATNIRDFSECVHGEYISFRIREETHSGICISEENEKKHVVLLESSDQNLLYKLVFIQTGMTVISYGLDWALSFESEQLSLYKGANTPGTCIQTDKGIFFVCRESVDPTEIVLCRLDDVGVVNSLPSGAVGFAFPYWEIGLMTSPVNQYQRLSWKRSEQS